ncbi:L-histidine N-alpha-methyltransferase [Nocardioides albertanoniae]|uniref:L-histidine N-alpha-methyltransferase n=1 Tax=Nocardioides albertanoniae TaxID=1175486 RepID=A0A543A5Q3_9ACTN|nr:L-histidine N(alpha)-methyltransferase [Nocardioides albertanoniae]TQL67910.1 L-histidine N-alpha-methyltransferase [Nocardioides albertanoniae]
MSLDTNGRTSTSVPSRLTSLLTDEDLRQSLKEDARTGLSASPKWLPPKYFYDQRGSELFEEITRLPEYYPTRTERTLLREHAGEIAELAGAEVLLELGSGSSEKTRLLLDALTHAGRLTTYVPVDVSSSALTQAMEALAEERPGLVLNGVVADFDQHLAQLPAPGRRLIALLGSTLGNYDRPGRERFLRSVADAMDPGESLLLGLDLVKDPGQLVAAYDDAAGVTAEFNLNALHVLNRSLRADFDPDGFRHLARWNTDEERIEMRLVAERSTRVELRELDLTIDFEDGEELLTELSCKFRRSSAADELTEAGFRDARWWTDPDEAYALVLAKR